MNQDFNQGSGGIPNNQPSNNNLNNAYSQQPMNFGAQQTQPNINNGFNQNYGQPINQYQQINPMPKKTNKTKKVLSIIGGIVAALITAFIVIFIVASINSEKLVCKSNEGNITIMYNKNGLIGYTAKGIIYDYDTQKQIAKQIGVKEYITEFNEWFVSNTTGSCTINGKKVE